MIAALVGPLLLVLGLATRLAAVLLLIPALALAFNAPLLSVFAFWSVLLGWYVVCGAGPLSFDYLIGRGFAASAVPFAAPLVRGFAWLKHRGWPVYMLLIRLVLAVIFLGFAADRLTDMGGALAFFGMALEGAWLQPDTVAWLTVGLELLCAVLLALGLAARIATLPLIVLSLALPFAYAGQSLPAYQILLLGLILFYGPGPLSLDRLIGERLARRGADQKAEAAGHVAELPHVVVVGAGFGGLAAAHRLRRAPVRVTMVDQHNYHLFQPFLYQVATAALTPADIATPIRELFRDQDNARVLLGRVTDVDPDGQAVVLSDGKRISYDFLVLATGSRHSYFGHDEWERLAPGLKRIEDATEVRRRLLLAFERAESAEDPEEQRRLMTFAVVGGGPTGAELAGAIAELARGGMQHEFTRINPSDARVLLIEAGPRILPAFPDKLAAIGKQSLGDLGVEVMTDSMVTDVDVDGLTIGGERRIDCRTVFWTAGVTASPAAEWVGADHDKTGRAKVGPDLSVPGRPNIFVIGDTALAEAWDGEPVPGLAQAAKQEGRYVAGAIRAHVEHRKPPRPFRYRHAGTLATIGRRSALADFGWIKLWGAPAWWLWGLVHVFFLSRMRNRIAVALEWFWVYLTYGRRTRLITGGEE